jgi:eukaryotic-like serine/threonine-protein kinase
VRPTAGTALGGRYRLDRRIAVGGMGEVWVGHDLTLGRDVAVKVLREEFAGEAGFLARFRTEARNAASLSHPNIAALFDYGEQGGSSYLVMELVAGEPLSDVLEREPVLPESRLLPVLAQTARALHAAHLAGVVHRDVKPGNILVGPGGRVKITDFGVSTAPDQAPMTATGMVMGTAQYLSPEQAVGRPATAASDLYSLGIVAYEALAGRRPFTGPTAVDIAVAHVNDPVPPLPPHVSPALTALVMRLLSKDPAERPATAASLARALDGLMGRTPPEGHELLDGDAGAPAAPVRPRAASAHPVGRGAGAPSARPAGTAPAGTSSAGTSATGTPAAGTAPAGSLPPSIAPPSYPPRRGPRDAGHRTGTAAPAVRPPGTAPTRPAARPPTGRPETAGRPAARPPAERPSTGGQRRSPGVGAAPARTAGRSGATRVAPSATPVRTSTTTGRRLGRLGRLSWPLVALLLLLLALLVAAVADSVGGSAGDPPPATGSACDCRVAPGGDPGAVGGMMPGVPPARPGGTDTTTAKDA